MKTLSEEELVDAAFECLKTAYTGCKPENFILQKHREIDGCITDGLVFVPDIPGFYPKIIGIESKTDKDNFTRLFNQVSAYLSVVDYVFLFVQSKKIPSNLPFFVGIIRARSSGESNIERSPVSLKHSIKTNEIWLTVPPPQKANGFSRWMNVIYLYIPAIYLLLCLADIAMKTPAYIS